MNQLFKKPEILAPAGSMDQFKAGLLYGADAFYLGGPRLSLRAKSDNFTWEELNIALKLAHENNRKIYFTLNILAQEHHLSEIREYLQELKSYPIDGLIIADPGVVQLAKEILPHLSIHLSTQANTSNSESVKFWQQHGVSRVNLARELDFKSIRSIRENCKTMELEVFVHGAMCMAISGRCLLSAYLNDRSANQGACSNPCRFDYRGLRVQFEEIKRRDIPTWELSQDNEFSRIFAADDLCLIKYIKWFMMTGIDSLKIEGRTKTAAYVAPIVDVYKTALQDCIDKKLSYKTYIDELSQISDRNFSTGFLLGKPRKQSFKTEKNKPIFAQIKEKISDGKWLIDVKEKWSAGSQIQALLPGLKRPSWDSKEFFIEDEKGHPLSVVNPGTKAVIYIENNELKPDMFLRLK
jgi:putative protease